MFKLNIIIFYIWRNTLLSHINNHLADISIVRCKLSSICLRLRLEYTKHFYTYMKIESLIKCICIYRYRMQSINSCWFHWLNSPMNVFVCMSKSGKSKLEFYRLVINHFLDKNTTMFVKKPVNSNKVNFLILFVLICTANICRN